MDSFGQYQNPEQLQSFDTALQERKGSEDILTGVKLLDGHRVWFLFIIQKVRSAEFQDQQQDSFWGSLKIWNLLRGHSRVFFSCFLKKYLQSVDCLILKQSVRKVLGKI